MPPSHLAHFPAQRVAYLNIYQDESKAPVWEQAMFVVWFFALYLPLPQFSLIRYACILVMLGMFAWHHRDSLPILGKSWYLLPYPIFATFSIFWTGYPQEAIRSAGLLLLTPILLVVVAIRLRPTELLRVLTISGALAALYCVPYFATLADGGPYEQKNLLAYQMMIVTLVCFATALNSKEINTIRLLGLFAAPLAFVIQLNADSATSLVFAVLGMVVLLGVKVFWLSVSNVMHLRTFMLALIFILLLTVGLILLSMPQNTFVADFLDMVGKDGTLTGRTGIWNAAELVSKEHPWIGVGLEGFWQRNVGLAQTLNELNHSDPGAKISFHSAFWEVRVHFGFIGLAFFLLTMVWAGVRTLALWLRDGSIVNSAFLIFYCIIAASCFTESYPAGTSSTIVTVFYFGAFAAFDIGSRKMVGRARLVQNEN
ncbi:O-antigen ligase family protein [Hyphomonas sp.]|uniref:O-antigen ligase family protein n=1 Tax=Hyphomonas sp. TaxID=87 RepID=UPI00391A106D